MGGWPVRGAVWLVLWAVPAATSCGLLGGVACTWAGCLVVGQAPPMVLAERQS